MLAAEMRALDDLVEQPTARAAEEKSLDTESD